MGLEERDDPGETVVTHVLEATENSGAEEHLRVAETVVVGVELKRCENFLRRNLSVDETLRDRIRGQDRVSEFRHNVGVSSSIETSRFRGISLLTAKPLHKTSLLEITTVYRNGVLNGKRFRKDKNKKVYCELGH